MVIHHFEGIDDLIATSYAYIGAYVADIFEKAMAEAGDDPLNRLRAVVNANFRPPVLDRDKLAVWLACWSLVRTNAQIRKTHAMIYRKYRRRLAILIERIAPARSLELDVRHRLWLYRNDRGALAAALPGAFAVFR